MCTFKLSNIAVWIKSVWIEYAASKVIFRVILMFCLFSLNSQRVNSKWSHSTSQNQYVYNEYNKWGDVSKSKRVWHYLVSNKVIVSTTDLWISNFQCKFKIFFWNNINVSCKLFIYYQDMDKANAIKWTFE